MITVCSVAAVCIIFAFPAWKILGLWLEQEISAAEFIIAMGVLVVFMLGIVRTWGEPEGILLWLLMILLGVAIALGTRASSKRRVKQFFNADVAAAERALAKDPDNAAAHMRLGTLYERNNDPGRAIEHYEQVVRLVPSDSEGKLCLATAIEKHRRAALQTVVCWKCGLENAETASHCVDCGELVSDKNQIIGWLTSKKFIHISIGAGAVFVLCAILGAIFKSIPWGLTAFAYVLLFLTVMCYLYPRWVRGRNQ
jgi:tetratricopeptide (TPR) repeat protein